MPEFKFIYIKMIEGAVIIGLIIAIIFVIFMIYRRRRAMGPAFIVAAPPGPTSPIAIKPPPEPAPAPSVLDLPRPAPAPAPIVPDLPPPVLVPEPTLAPSVLVVPGPAPVPAAPVYSKTPVPYPDFDKSTLGNNDYISIAHGCGGGPRGGIRLQCDSGRVIKTIGATYGAVKGGNCPNDGLPIDEDRYLINATADVASAADGKDMFEFLIETKDKGGIFSADPYPGAGGKNLEVVYACMMP